MGFFEPSVMGGGGGGRREGPHHNFVVIAPMIIKLGTGVKHDVFHTLVTYIHTYILFAEWVVQPWWKGKVPTCCP